MRTLFVFFLFLSTLTTFAQLPPGTDPALDATGTLTQLADIEGSCAISRQKVVDSVQLDYHPVYGKITSEMFPVSDSGFQLDQLGTWLPAGTKKFEVDTVEFSGVGLVQHRIGDEDIFVWHRMENAELVRIAYEDPGTSGGNSAMRFILINSYCGNWVVITLCDELDPYCNWLYNRFD